MLMISVRQELAQLPILLQHVRVAPLQLRYRRLALVRRVRSLDSRHLKRGQVLVEFGIETLECAKVPPLPGRPAPAVPRPARS